MEPRQFSRGNLPEGADIVFWEVFQWSHGNSAVGTKTISGGVTSYDSFQWSHGNSAVGTYPPDDNNRGMIYLFQWSHGNSAVGT